MFILKTHKSASIDVPNKRTVEHLSGVLLMALLVTFVLLPVNNAEAATPSHTLENADAQRIGSNRVLSGALACGNAFEQGGSSGSRCFMEQMVNGILLDQTTHYANAYGKRLFGETFLPRQPNDLFPGRGRASAGKWMPWCPCRRSRASSASADRKPERMPAQRTARFFSSKA